MFTAKIYTMLDREMVLYNFAAESFQTNKFCSRLYSTELKFYSQKRQIRFWVTLWRS